MGTHCVLVVWQSREGEQDHKCSATATNVCIERLLQHVPDHLVPGRSSCCLSRWYISFLAFHLALYQPTTLHNKDNPLFILVPINLCLGTAPCRKKKQISIFPLTPHEWGGQHKRCKRNGVMESRGLDVAYQASERDVKATIIGGVLSVFLSPLLSLNGSFLAAALVLIASSPHLTGRWLIIRHKTNPDPSPSRHHYPTWHTAMGLQENTG